MTTALRALAAVAALAASAQAFAATEPFSGPYIGGEIGWQQDKLKSTITGEGGTTETNRNGDSFSYGGQLGYDFKVNPSFVIGAEAAVSGDTNKIRSQGFTADAGRTFSLTGRAGALVTSKTLLYAKGGWTNGRFSYDTPTDGTTRSRDGWLVGAGLEHLITDNVSARVEYRYSQFNRLRSTIDGEDLSARFRRNAVAVGVNYRF